MFTPMSGWNVCCSTWASSRCKHRHMPTRAGVTRESHDHNMHEHAKHAKHAKHARSSAAEHVPARHGTAARGLVVRRCLLWPWREATHRGRWTRGSRPDRRGAPSSAQNVGVDVGRTWRVCGGSGCGGCGGGGRECDAAVSMRWQRPPRYGGVCWSHGARWCLGVHDTTTTHLCLDLGTVFGCQELAARVDGGCEAALLRQLLRLLCSLLETQCPVVHLLLNGGFDEPAWPLWACAAACGVSARGNNTKHNCARRAIPDASSTSSRSHRSHRSSSSCATHLQTP